MPILWIVLAVIAALVLVLYGGGSLIARDHRATCTIVLAAPPEQVFAAISDWRSFPSWRRDVRTVEERPGGGWIETGPFGRISLIVERSEPPSEHVTRIDDDTLPFGGTWTHRLERTPEGGTRLATTEDGFVKPPPFRLMARLFFGYHASQRGFQRALAAKLGERADPVDS